MNFVKTPKQRDYTVELEEKAIEFHGHGGPFMIIGLRMGLAALDKLDSRGWFGIRCKAYLRWAPPDSCVIDGVQSSTGCTMGKHNIEVEEAGGIAVEFSVGEKRVRVTLREDTLSFVRGSFDAGDEAVETCMARLREVGVDELFHVEWV
ncbi:MAG: formylmethanofuran dehydrogenase subunit E family protein [Candidatus Bathyarchaeota archaeon]